MSTEENLFIEMPSPSGTRTAILEDNGTCAWLVLAESPDGSILGDCFVYNRIPPVEDSEVRSYAPGPPPVSKSFASPLAMVAEPSAHTIQLCWQSAGDYVTVEIDGVSWARLYDGEPRGLSRALSRPGPYGSPWPEDDQE